MGGKIVVKWVGNCGQWVSNGGGNVLGMDRKSVINCWEMGWKIYIYNGCLKCGKWVGNCWEMHGRKWWEIGGKCVAKGW